MNPSRIPVSPAPIFLAVPMPDLIGAGAAAGGPRTFSGVAYSGEVMDYFGQRICIDLATLRPSPPLPVLVQHEREHRVGVCTLAVTDHQLTAQGRLLSNARAAAVATDADEGFPWQLSIHATPGRTDALAAGATALVNGRTITGPASILRDVRVRELSFTPTGVDPDTTARVLALAEVALPPHSPLPSETPMDQVTDLAPGGAETAAALDARLAAETQRANAAEATLTALRDGIRRAEITALFAALGRPAPDKALPVYLALADDAWAAVAADLRAARPQPPAHLFAEQATDGVAAAAGAAGFTAALAAEFGDEATYRAYRAAEAAGRIKHYGGSPA